MFVDGICIAFEKLKVHPQETIGDIFGDKQPIALRLDIIKNPGNNQRNISHSFTTNEVEYIASRNAYVFDQGFCLSIQLDKQQTALPLSMKVHVIQELRKLFSFSYDVNLDTLALTPSVGTMWGSVTQSTSRGEVMSNSQSQLNDLDQGLQHSYSDLVFKTFRPC